MRQVIEGKLQEGDDVHNVQVVVQEATSINVSLSLLDEDGVFLNVAPFQQEVKESSSESEETLQKLAKAEQKRVELETKLEWTREMLAKERERTAKLTEELSSATATTAASGEIAELKAKLKDAQDKTKKVWHLSCTQGREQEES